VEPGSVPSRSNLRIRRPKGHGGSTPPSRTTSADGRNDRVRHHGGPTRMEGLHTSLDVMFVGGGICEFIHPS